MLILKLMLNIKNLRADKKLKQHELALMLDFDKGYLSHIETGKREMSKELFNKFIEVFGLETVNRYLVEEFETRTVPFYDKESVIMLRDFSLLRNEKPKYNIDVPLVCDAEFAIVNFDDSMAPYALANDIILFFMIWFLL